MLRTYSGSCHCGAVQFETDADISAGTDKCNCSVCTKMRLWSVQVRPEQFRLIVGESELVDYQFNSKVAHHLFCRHCGIHAFEWVDVPNMSGGIYYNVSVACLDGVDIEELMSAPVSYCDGLNNDWGAVPSEVRHL